MTDEQYQGLVTLVAGQLRIKLKCDMHHVSSETEDATITGILGAAVVMGVDNERLMQDARQAMKDRIRAESRAMVQGR